MKYRKLAASIASLLDEINSAATESLIARPRAFPLSSSGSRGSPEIDVFLRCKEKADFADSGIQVHQESGEVRTAKVRLDQIEALAEHAAVTRISAARLLRPLDLASTKVKLPAYRSANPGRTGTGVIVGVVDSGIDVNHPAFAGRIKSIWDQNIRGIGWGTTRYGTVLTGPAMSNSTDTNGHGTHVAGIAAGRHATFGGVAPDADLVIVNTNFQNTGIADGVRYIFTEAAKVGRPAVVNLSLGGHFDPHDGTDDLSLAIDQMTGPGRIVVAAAGNEGEDPIHGQVRIAAGKTASMTFRTPPSSSPTAPPWVVLNGWYGASSTCEISITTPGGNTTPAQRVITTASPTRNYTFPTARIRLTTPGPAPTNSGDIQFLAEIQPGGINTRVQGGAWTVTIKNRGTSAVTVDVWSIVDGDFAIAAMQAPTANSAMKIGSPGSSASAVTVAAFTTRNTWVDSAGSPRAVGLTLDDIAGFSSPGPLRNKAKKPDLTAPGAMIVSCQSAASAPRASSIVAPGFLVEAGTSMASPFVSGLVALLLQANLQATPAQIKAKLRAACAIPHHPSVAFDPKWGAGLIDASKL